MVENVILVNNEDQEIGVMEKMLAHEKGLLHRAFSVFIINSNGEILLQKRNSKKYHSGGLWSNTCCSHPRPGETTIEAAERRLHEEMGMFSKLAPAFSFIYKSELDNNLIEHELDHIFLGYSNQVPKINIEEVEDFQYINPNKLSQEIITNPDYYTSWLKICLDRVLVHMKEQRLMKKIA